MLVDPARLPNPAKVSSDELQGYYRQHADEFRVPESVKVRHILIKLPLPGPDGKVDAKQAAAAKAKAQDVLNQLRKGGDFAALAKKYSDDTATAKNGGSVGQLVQGSGSAPEIEKVAFGLAKGQTSDLIPTSYGFEIIRVDDKIAAHARSLDEVRSEIEPIVAAQKNQRRCRATRPHRGNPGQVQRSGQGCRKQWPAGAGERSTSRATIRCRASAPRRSSPTPSSA